MGELAGVAESLATFDGGLVSTVKVESTTSSWALAALLAVAFLGLGVALVLVMAPLDTAIQEHGRNIENVAGPNSLIAVTNSGHDLWPLAAAIRRMDRDEVLLIPTGSKDAGDIADAVRQLFNDFHRRASAQHPQRGAISAAASAGAGRPP